MFRKGQSGNPAGMKPGTKVQRTAEVRALARQLFDRTYWQFTRDRLMAGTLNPRLEITLLAYAYGEPPRDEGEHGPRFLVSIGFLQRDSSAVVTLPHSTQPEPHSMAPPPQPEIVAVGDLCLPD